MPSQTLNGYEMHYQVFGTGQPIVIIHGGLGGGDGSANIVSLHSKQISESFQLVVFDRRAAGKSSAPANGYSIKAYSNDVYCLLDHLSIDKTHIVGSSAGGPIAIQFALDNPEKTRTLGLVNTMSYTDRTERIRRQEELDILEDTSASSKRTQLANALDVRRPGLREAEPTHFQHLLDLNLKQYDGIVSTMRSYIDIADSIDLRLSEITMPTVIIHGSSDTRIPIRCGKDLRDKIRGAIFHTVEGAEHGLLANEPDKVRNILINFWKGNPIV
ncbi:MAG: hypothetical protein CL886_01775 [Dehalococcoidia bacterium]|nr:hypothetical protein [Dehalococcoidia bacterium]|tara:strand:- start:7987 stop:8802 length:816 start_codon:yes stop_codon:yes gene_type:complete